MAPLSDANTHTQKQSFAQYLPTSLTRTCTSTIEVHKKQPMKLISSPAPLSTSPRLSPVFMALVVRRKISPAEVTELPGRPRHSGRMSVTQRKTLQLRNNLQSPAHTAGPCSFNSAFSVRCHSFLRQRSKLSHHSL